MAGERIDYTAAAVDAAKSVLIELMHILGEYRDDMVLVGGWIPDLLIPTSQERHVGSIDVDLALNHKELTEAGYRMIGEILRQHSYTQDQQQPFIFRKDVRGQTVQVDFLAGEYGGTGKSRRTQKVLDMQPRKARGCDLAFQISPALISVEPSYRRGGPTWSEITLHRLVWSVICEFVGPVWLHRGTADLWDVAANAVGSVGAGIWWNNRPQSKTKAAGFRLACRRHLDFGLRHSDLWVR